MINHEMGSDESVDGRSLTSREGTCVCEWGGSELTLSTYRKTLGFWGSQDLIM